MSVVSSSLSLQISRSSRGEGSFPTAAPSETPSVGWIWCPSDVCCASCCSSSLSAASSIAALRSEVLRTRWKCSGSICSVLHIENTFFAGHPRHIRRPHHLTIITIKGKGKRGLLTSHMNTLFLTDLVAEAVKVAESGRVATYIPELSKANKFAVGVAFCGLKHGRIEDAGDCRTRFTMQSISK